MASRKSHCETNIIRWLSPLKFDIKYYEEELERLRRARHPGTCQWILKHSIFQTWTGLQNTTSCNFLWISAIPGAGKSTLSAFLIDHIRDHGLGFSPHIFFFFLKSGSEDTSSHLAAVRSLLYQLYQQLSSKDERFVQDLSYHRDRSGPEQSRSPRLLWDIFRKYVSSIPSSTLIIDGLDECDAPSTFLHNLKELAQSPNIRTIVLSRRSPDIINDSSGYPNLHFGKADLHNDILVYVESEISKSNKLRHADVVIYLQQRLNCTLAHALSERSQGLFLWASLVLKEVAAAARPSDMVAMLDEMPSTLVAIYGRILERLARDAGTTRRNTSAAFLKWIACAMRPLSMDETRAAPSVGSDGKLKTYDICDKPILSEDDLALACGSLVFIDDRKVRLAHITVRDFLRNLPTSSRGSEYLERFSIDWPRENLLIASHCMNYMSLSFGQYTVPGTHERRMIEVDAVRDSNPLLDYAVHYWLHHLIESNAVLVDQADVSFFQFLLTPMMLCWLEMWFTVAPDGLWRLKHLMKSLQSWCPHSSSSLGGNSSLISKWAATMLELLQRHGMSLERDPSHIHSIDPAFFVDGNGDYCIFANFKVPEPPCHMRQYRVTPITMSISTSKTQSITYPHRSMRTISAIDSRPYGMFHVDVEHRIILIVDLESSLPALRCQHLDSGQEIEPVHDRQRSKGHYRRQAHCINTAKDSVAVLFRGVGHVGGGGYYVIVWSMAKSINLTEAEPDRPWSEVKLSLFIGAGACRPGPQPFAFCGKDDLHCLVGRIEVASGKLDESTRLSDYSQMLSNYQDSDIEVHLNEFAYSQDGMCLVTYDPCTSEILRRSSDLTCLYSSVSQRLGLFEICSISRTGRYVLWRDGMVSDENPKSLSTWYLLDFVTGASRDIGCEFDGSESSGQRPAFSIAEDCIVSISKGFDQHAIEVQTICVHFIALEQAVKYTSLLCSNITNFSFVDPDYPLHIRVAGQVTDCNVRDISRFSAGFESAQDQGICLKQRLSDDGRRLGFLGLSIVGTSRV